MNHRWRENIAQPANNVPKPNPRADWSRASSPTQQQVVVQNMTPCLTCMGRSSDTQPTSVCKRKPRWNRPDSTFICESQKHAKRQKMQSKVPAGRRPLTVDVILRWVCISVQVQKVQNQNLLFRALGCQICHQMLRVTGNNGLSVWSDSTGTFRSGSRFTVYGYSISCEPPSVASSTLYGLLPCFKKLQQTT